MFVYDENEVIEMDRGSIKWTSLMLPEHVQLLKDLWEEDYNTHKPILDSQEIEEMDKQLRSAFVSNTPITISIYSNQKTKEYTGTITRLTHDGIVIQLKNGERVPLSFQQIISIS